MTSAQDTQGGGGLQSEERAAGVAAFVLDSDTWLGMSISRNSKSRQ